MLKIKKEYFIAGVVSLAVIGISAFSIYYNSNLLKESNESTGEITNKTIDLIGKEKSIPAAVNAPIENTNSNSADNQQALSGTSSEKTKPKEPAEPATTSTEAEETQGSLGPEAIGTANDKPIILDFKPVIIVYKEYSVKQGDTLSKIWRENIVCISFSKAKSMICHENQLASEDDLKPGQSLKIPMVQYENYITYKVSKGDTLSAIARRYKPDNVTESQYVNIIVKINLEENVQEIETEQVILLPKF